ncbi:unnamed protein product [Trichogramma brassicae]|uniref:Uncharacterized protein n=1 Tax=Trichogramma brassicae TaxID=86971 RepID=A0A6H5HZ90_9HYME|nr:unnamed protein product [Trichogramma brassicae]
MAGAGSSHSRPSPQRRATAAAAAAHYIFAPRSLAAARLFHYDRAQRNRGKINLTRTRLHLLAQRRSIITRSRASAAPIDVAPYVRIMYQYSRGRIELQRAVIAHVWIFNVPSMSRSRVSRSVGGAVAGKMARRQGRLNLTRRTEHSEPLSRLASYTASIVEYFIISLSSSGSANSYSSSNRGDSPADTHKAAQHTCGGRYHKSPERKLPSRRRTSTRSLSREQIHPSGSSPATTQLA